MEVIQEIVQMWMVSCFYLIKRKKKCKLMKYTPEGYFAWSLYTWEGKIGLQVYSSGFKECI